MGGPFRRFLRSESIFCILCRSVPRNRLVRHRLLTLTSVDGAGSGLSGIGAVAALESFGGRSGMISMVAVMAEVAHYRRYLQYARKEDHHDNFLGYILYRNTDQEALG